MLLLAGRVKVTRTDEDGRETLLSLRDPGDVLGELSFIDGEPRIATVTALEPVEALLIADRAFRTHLETTPRVAVVLLETVARRLREATVKRSQFAASDTMGRLSARIVELAERYGQPGNGGISISSPLSQEELAAWTGASRAGVAQALQSLRELGWLETQRRTLIVRDPEALARGLSTSPAADCRPATWTERGPVLDVAAAQNWIVARPGEADNRVHGVGARSLGRLLPLACTSHRPPCGHRGDVLRVERERTVPFPSRAPAARDRVPPGGGCARARRGGDRDRSSRVAVLRIGSRANHGERARGFAENPHRRCQRGAHAHLLARSAASAGSGPASNTGRGTPRRSPPALEHRQTGPARELNAALSRAARAPCRGRTRQRTPGRARRCARRRRGSAARPLAASGGAAGRSRRRRSREMPRGSGVSR
jgi:CRP/FNR family transcriptional regulator, cyclic AMP receptor protein